MPFLSIKSLSGGCSRDCIQSLEFPGGLHGHTIDSIQLYIGDGWLS